MLYRTVGCIKRVLKAWSWRGEELSPYVGILWRSLNLGASEGALICKRDILNFDLEFLTKGNESWVKECASRSNKVFKVLVQRYFRIIIHALPYVYK